MTIKQKVKGILTLPITLLSSIIPFLNTGAFSMFAFPSFVLETKAEMRQINKPDANSQNIPILQAAVNLDPNPAKGGGDITIIDGIALMAESGLAGTTLDIEKANHTGKISVYEVRPGDTLSGIAQMFNVSANTIKWANDLNGPIQPGQTLVILPVTGITHTVKSGGTIEDIAKLYKADVREIALFNGLDEKVELKKGDKVIVPNVELESKTSASGLARSSAGYFMNPLPRGVITQRIHGYNGIDVGAPAGTAIYAAASGKVLTSKVGGWNGGYGNMIVISHDNGTQTLYSHMSENSVYVGQWVEKGDVIGYVGSTGKSTGNHLHFEVRGATNPLSKCSVGSVCKI